MSTLNSIKTQPQHPSVTTSSPKSGRHEKAGIHLAHKLEKQRYTLEAKRRSSLVRGVGNPVAGYVDGYADGFEHAMRWLLGQLSDPLTADYRPDAGMAFAKTYYACHPKDRKAILRHFEKNGAPNENR